MQAEVNFGNFEELNRLLEDYKKFVKRDTRTVGMIVDEYINLSSLLSPSTLYGYKKIREFAFPDLMTTQVCDLTSNVMQSHINREILRADGLSPKTVKNEYALVSAALRSICDLNFNVRLPKVQHKNKVLPQPENIIKAVKGTDIELPCLLAMWLSFSMSEIRGFKCSSIKNGFITVDNVMLEVGTEQVFKTSAKVDSRIRKQSIPPYIMKLINDNENYRAYKKTRKDSLLIPDTRNQIYHRFERLMEKNDITMSFHDLRHVFASVMLTKLNIPEKIVQEEGGWSTDYVMKTVYSNVFTDSRIEADKIRDEYFIGLLTD